MTTQTAPTKAAVQAAPTMAFRLKNFALGGLAGMCATCFVSEFIFTCLI